MATVPGQRMEDATGGIPKELQPTQADLLMAASITMERQRKLQQQAMQIEPLNPKNPEDEEQPPPLPKAKPKKERK